MKLLYNMIKCAVYISRTSAIIMSMIQACSVTIPISKSDCSNVKDVPGWNEYIEGYFRPHSSGTVFGLIMVNLYMVLLLI